MEAAKVSTRLFPGDVVADIMARLPVKSPKRFRSVAKSWCSLIQSPEFITSRKNKVRPLLKHGTYVADKEKTVVSLLPDQISSLDMDRDSDSEGKTMVSLISKETIEAAANFDIPFFTTSGRRIVLFSNGISMVGCCNAILCIWDCENVLFWNLATQEFKVLPSNPFGPYKLSFVDAIGFGYDSQGDDYKVVRIDTTSNIDFDFFVPEEIPEYTRVALYSFTTDSWRGFDAKFRFRFESRNEKSQVYSNGFYHFWVSVGDGSKESILSFDFSEEVFITTPFPDTLDHFGGFMEIYGSLGVLSRRDRCEPCGCDVWALGEVGVKNSWTKLFTTEPISVGFYLLGASNNGHELFFAEDKSEKDVSELSDQFFLDNNDITMEPSLELEMYAESLVSLSK